MEMHHMRPRTFAFFAIVFSLFVLSLPAADWPQFRGPGSLATSTDKDLPTTWDSKSNVVWKAKMPGSGASSVITVGDRLFVACYSGYGIDKGGDQGDLKRHLICLDRKSGTIKWDKSVKAITPETRYGGFIALHGYASSTPVSDGEHVYVFHGKTGVFAYDLNGKELWNQNLGKGTDGWGSASSPVLYKNLVIVNAAVEGGAVFALDKTNGKQVWKSGSVRRTWASPVLVDLPNGQKELVLNAPKVVMGLDPETGKELWTCEGINDYICSSVVAKEGIVYAIGGRSATAVAVRAGGRGNVTSTHQLWRKSVGSNVTSPVLVGDHLYWVNDGGTAYCLDAKDGKTVYSERLPNTGRVYASATAADGKLYVVSRDKGTFVLAAKPAFAKLAHNDLGDTSIFNASPAVSDGQLFLRSDKWVYCLGMK
jgi:hypothetical protein